MKSLFRLKIQKSKQCRRQNIDCASFISILIVSEINLHFIVLLLKIYACKNNVFHLCHHNFYQLILNKCSYFVHKYFLPSIDRKKRETTHIENIMKSGKEILITLYNFTQFTHIILTFINNQVKIMKNHH